MHYLLLLLIGLPLVGCSQHNGAPVKRDAAQLSSLSKQKLGTEGAVAEVLSKTPKFNFLVTDPNVKSEITSATLDLNNKNDFRLALVRTTDLKATPATMGKFKIGISKTNVVQLHTDIDIEMIFVPTTDPTNLCVQLTTNSAFDSPTNIALVCQKPAPVFPPSSK